MTLDAFFDLKQQTPEQFKRMRQAAKAVNFGIGGGMQANSLVAYARATYGVTLSLEESQQMRQHIISDIYPELQLYLSDDLMEALAENMRCTAIEMWELIDCRRPAWLPYVMRRIVAGLGKRNGQRYQPSFVRRVWSVLGQLCENADVATDVRSRNAGPELESSLFTRRTATLTGRIRGRLRNTQSFNTPFQGLAADGGKLSLFELIRQDFKIVAYVHDEIVIEVGANRADSSLSEIEKIMKTQMTSVLGVPIPVKVDAIICDRWAKP